MRYLEYWNTYNRPTKIIVDDDFVNPYYDYTPHVDPYGYVTLNGRPLAHLIIDVPPGFEADHANGNPLDNRRTNLRIVTHHQNVMNRRGWGRSKHKGVSFDQHSGKWRASLTYLGKRHYSRYHHSEIAAAREYNKLATVQHGDFARLNEVPWCAL